MKVQNLLSGMEEKQVEEISEAEIIQTEEIKSEVTPEESTLDPKEKKIKNLISLVILLGGLFVGSLFVDVVQMVRGGGFSERALKNSDVFSSTGKTWVAYNDPIIKIQVINDDTCENCKPDEALVGLRRVMPTMLTEKIDVNSQQGKALVEKFNIKTVPAFIFSKELENTDLFAQAQALFEKKDDSYALNTVELGLPVGKYVAGPTVSDSDPQFGPKDAKVKFVEFSDFQAPAGKQFEQQVIAKLKKDYGDRVLFVFKHFPLPSHVRAPFASMASECANEQGKFDLYADKLFTTQSVWGKTKDDALFKVYAKQLGLNSEQFDKCVDDKKFQDQVATAFSEGQAFGLTTAPSLFINDQLQSGSLKYDDLKKAIEEQLAK
jgi:protein-disulfide isomerase